MTSAQKECCLPAKCAVSLTFCDMGENGPGMEKIGCPTNKPVSMDALEAMKRRFEGLDVVGGKKGVAELYNLKDNLVKSHDISRLPEVREAGVLVLRNFADTVLGAGILNGMEKEVQSMKEGGLVDEKALMRGQVKNKNARHNNVIADFSQQACIAEGRGTVVPFENYPLISKMREAAADWMQQDFLVAEQNRYFDVKDCGIGWHGDAERQVVWGLRLGKATEAMPLMFNAWHRCTPIGAKTVLYLQPGDVYVMSQVAVGTDWKFNSRVTWRHAAGSATCKYSKDPKPKLLKRKRLNE